MTVATFNTPNNTTMTGTQYLAAVDGAVAVLAGVAAQFAPHQQSSANMTVVVDAGAVLNGTTLTSKAQQSTGVITAPTNGTQRIDRVVVSSSTGNVSVITGTQSNSPAVPSLITGNFPVAQVLLLANSTAISNSMITDERNFRNSNAETATTATNQSGGTVNASQTGEGAAIASETDTGYGVLSTAAAGVAVQGNSTTGGIGVRGISSSGTGVYAYSATGRALIAVGDSTSPTTAALHIGPQDTQPTGPNIVGDIYVTTAGVLKICTVAGTPGTWTSVGAQT